MHIILNRKYFQYFILLIFHLSFILSLVGQDFSFKRITFDEGLSNNTVLSFYKDRSGFLWIGTRDGLNRFDGYRIKRYKSTINDSTSLSTNNYINVIQENPYTSNLWIGTQDGINIYRHDSDDFYRVKTPLNWREKHFAILSMHFDKNRALLGTNKGLIFVSALEKEFVYSSPLLTDCEVYSVVPYLNGYLLGTNKGLYILIGAQSVKLVKSTEHLLVRNINVLNNNRIWLSTESNGIIELDGDFKILFEYNQSNFLKSNSVRFTKSDSNGNVWIATMHGASLYSKNNNTFIPILSDNFNSYSLSDNSIRTVYIDNQQTVWLGTNFGGVNYYNRNNYNFKLDAADSRFEYTISGNLVSTIFLENEHKLWVGTERDGLNIKDLRTGKFTRFPVNSHTVKSLYINDKYVFVGTFNSGLIRVNRKNYNDVLYFDTSGRNGIKLSQNYISSITQDKHGNIWVGTGSAGVDIIQSDFKSVKYINTKLNSELTSDYIKSIVFDNHNKVWIGTGLGLNCFDLNTERFLNLDSIKNKLNSFYINSLFYDNNNTLWIGTQEEGLYKLSIHENKLEQQQLLSIPTNSISGITSDKNNNLIVTTNVGVVFYNTKLAKGSLRSNLDGLPTNQYMPNAIVQHNNSLIVGSYKGLLTLDYSNELFKKSTANTKILLSEIHIANLDDNDVSKLLRVRNVNSIDEVNLKHYQNNIRLLLGTDDFVNPLKYTFYYRFKNKTSEWTASNNSELHFSGLSYGKYILEIKVLSTDGNWSEYTREVVINISPPYYFSIWAYLVYSLIIALVIWQFVRYMIERQRLKTQLYYEAKNFKMQESVMRSKIDFFTKISHEIRTPLSLVSAPVEKILNNNELEESNRKLLNIAYKNIRRLSQILDELLTFRKIDEKKFKLRIEPIDSISFFESINEMFMPMADKLNTEFKIKNTFNGIFFADRNYFEKVVVNIVSNAFKFSSDYSKGILLSVSKDNNEIVVSIYDDGVGISKEHQEHIFDEFYQVNDHSRDGWGIGLHFCKEIVDCHYGRIEVESGEKGIISPYKTCFKIILPLNTVNQNSLIENQSEIPLSISKSENNFDHIEEDFQILIVEDNVELREFLIEHIGLKYSVLFASNGREGLDFAMKNIPDIIISDIAMPNIDGLEMVKLLKENHDTSHIPVIFLTARGEEEDIIEGYKVGVINYVTKPFNVGLLDMQINNVLEAIRTSKTLNQDYLLETSLTAVNNKEEEEPYLAKLKQEIFDNISNPEFSVQSLASHMAQSQSSLLKKVKSLTGLSVKELITQIRLQKASELLKHTNDITEVAYQVGYTDRKYFSKEFKRKFDLNPSEYHIKMR